MIGAYKKLLRVTGGGRTFLLLLLLRAPFDMGSTIVHATVLQKAFNAVNQGDTAGLTTICLLFGVASLCLFLYNGTVWSLYAPFCARMEGRLRVKLFYKIASLPYERIEAAGQGEWVTRLNTDVEMPFSRGFHLPHAACAVANIGASAIILWRLNPAVLGWVMLFVVPHILFSRLFIARAMPGLSKKSLEAMAKTTGELTALLTCADVAALYEGRAYLLGRFEKSSRALVKANMKLHARNALAAGVVPLFGLGGYLTLLTVGSAWIAAGNLTLGDLTAAFQYRSGVLTGSMVLSSCLISIQASMAGIRRMNETMAEKTEGQDE